MIISYNNDYDYSNAKTFRVCVFSVTLIVLGFFLLLFKSKSCEHKVKTKENCEDSFVSVEYIGGSSSVCSVGATIEIVTSPPAPKAGIICRCSQSAKPSTSSSN